jgi:hypothetical protein
VLMQSAGDGRDVARLLSSVSATRSATAPALSWVTGVPLAPAARTGPPANGVCGGPTPYVRATGVIRPRTIGGAIYPERLNEPEVALARW